MTNEKPNNNSGWINKLDELENLQTDLFRNGDSTDITYILHFFSQHQLKLTCPVETYLTSFIPSILAVLENNHMEWNFQVIIRSSLFIMKNNFDF